MFEVGKRYKYIYNGDIIYTVLYIGKQNVFLSWESKDTVYESVVPINSFIAYEEYKEPVKYSHDVILIQNNNTKEVKCNSLEHGRRYSNPLWTEIDRKTVTFEV